MPSSSDSPQVRHLSVQSEPPTERKMIISTLTTALLLVTSFIGPSQAGLIGTYRTKASSTQDFPAPTEHSYHSPINQLINHQKQQQQQQTSKQNSNKFVSYHGNNSILVQSDDESLADHLRRLRAGANQLERTEVTFEPKVFFIKDHPDAVQQKPGRPFKLNGRSDNSVYELLNGSQLSPPLVEGEAETSGVASTVTKRKVVDLSPIILVPGYGGSRLEAKWNKSQAEHYFCETQSNWTNIWIDVKQLLPYMIDCLIENFRLEFDEQTNTTHNTKGVEIRVKDPESLASVEYLNSLRISSFGYFAAIIKQLTGPRVGYTRQRNLRGAPYDFRKAPNEMAAYFDNLKRMVESLVHGQRGEKNEQQETAQERLTFICHSMGCNNVLYFLQRQTSEWKRRYVRQLISIAAPWGGSLSALQAVAFGDNLGMPYLFDEAKLNIAQRSLPSTIYLLPNKRVMGDAPLIRTNTHSKDIPDINSSRQGQDTYTAQDYSQFFAKINHPNGYRMWLNTRNLLGSLEAPEVEVWCLYGEGHRTVGRLEFLGDFPNSEKVELYDDGDGTVTTQSSTFCKQWARQQEQPVHLRGFPLGHAEILKDPEVIDTIEDILQTTNAMRNTWPSE